MDKYYVRFNRFVCAICWLVYSFSSLNVNAQTFCPRPQDFTNCSNMNRGNLVFTPEWNETTKVIMCVTKNTNSSGQIPAPEYGGTCEGVKPKCTPQDVPPHGNFDGKPYWNFSGKNLSGSICVDNCVAKGDWDGNMKTSSGWETFFKGSMRITGEECTPPPDDKKDDGDCGPGYGSVTINGNKKCVKNGDPNDKNDPSKPKPATKQQTSTACSSLRVCVTTETKTETKNTPNGGTEETTTTTTTTRDADGNVTGTGTETSTTIKDKGNLDNSNDEKDKDDEEKKDLCEKNPTLNICKNSAVHGECENTTCEGDAITCALVQLQRKTDCEIRQDTPEKALGTLLNAKNDPLKSSLPTLENAQQVDLGALNLNANGWGAGGSCIADRSISVMGKVVSIPLSSLCDYLLALRAAIMLLAGILSFKIVSGAVLTV